MDGMPWGGRLPAGAKSGALGDGPLAFRMWWAASPGAAEELAYYRDLAAAAHGPVQVREEPGGMVGASLCAALPQEMITCAFAASPAKVSPGGDSSDGGRYTLVAAPSGAVERFVTKAHRFDFFNRVRNALQTGGRLVMDFSTGPVEESATPLLVGDWPMGGERRLLWRTVSHEPATDRFELRLALEKVRRSGRVWHKSYHHHLLVRLEPDSLAAELGDAGFEVVARHPGFCPPTWRREVRHAWVARKRAGAVAERTRHG